jgi:hypothetical protein
LSPNALGVSLLELLVMQLDDAEKTQFGQCLFHRIRRGQLGHPFPPHLKVAHPLRRD